MGALALQPREDFLLMLRKSLTNTGIESDALVLNLSNGVFEGDVRSKALVDEIRPGGIGWV